MDIILKLVSESLLSFYPAMVKYIPYPVYNQLQVRLFIYTIISAIFSSQLTHLLPFLISPIGILLAITNLFHVWSSYVGFKNLDAGVSYSLFYIYPLLIILFAGNTFRWYFLLPLLGVYFLTKSQNQAHSQKSMIGILAILGAAVSEAMIYFIVKKIQNGNKWDTLFIAYFFPAVAVTLYLIFTKKLIPTVPEQKNDILSQSDKKEEKFANLGASKYFILLLLGNAIIGAIGYYLRFYTIDRLPSSLYGILSYVGIVMAYVYGYILNNDEVTLQKIIGSVIIIFSSLFFF